jgi:glycosyltransferase involved in cell wall biosynthesis
MRILLVEPYLGGSHRAWAEGYRDHSSHEVVLVSHEARFWKWRMQGAALTLAEAARTTAAEHGPPDIVMASDMVDLPTFAAAARDVVGDAPLVLYMHENQLTYPLPPEADPDHAYAMVNWRSVALADLVLFNSEFHLGAFYEELPRFLKGFPDYDHLYLVEGARGRSEVMAPGVDLGRLDGKRPAPDGPPVILWNQRWEYDKAPKEFFGALDRLAEDEMAFRVIIAGENFRQQPAEFSAARRRLGGRVIHFGFAPEDEYPELLRRSDIVVSAAHHEFFGIAVVEAIYARVFPILPNRLSYPELLPANFHDPCLYYGGEDLVRRLTWALRASAARQGIGRRAALAMRRFDWSLMAPGYDRRLEELNRSGG